MAEESKSSEDSRDEHLPSPDDDSSTPQQDVSRPRLITQFVVFPIAIVLVGVSIYLFLGILTSDTRTAGDYLNTIHRGGINSRWQAAFELVKVLASERKAGTMDPQFADEIVRVFDRSTNDDPRVRRYLARAMELVEGPAVVAALIGALEDPDEETRLYAIHSLGRLRAEASIPDLLRFVNDEDAGFRKSALYALGQMKDPRILKTLKIALDDGEADVRWNAALQLARRGDDSGERILGEMINRPFLETLEMSEAQRVTAMVYSIRSIAALKLKKWRALIGTLKSSDVSMKVRQAAIEALEDWETP